MDWAKDRRAKGAFVPRPLEKEERRKRRTREEGEVCPGPARFLSVALKGGDKTQNRMRKVEIDDKNIVYVK